MALHPGGRRARSDRRGGWGAAAGACADRWTAYGRGNPGAASARIATPRGAARAGQVPVSATRSAHGSDPSSRERNDPTGRRVPNRTTSARAARSSAVVRAPGATVLPVPVPISAFVRSGPASRSVRAGSVCVEVRSGRARPQGVAPSSGVAVAAAGTEEHRPDGRPMPRRIAPGRRSPTPDVAPVSDVARQVSGDERRAVDLRHRPTVVRPGSPGDHGAQGARPGRAGLARRSSAGAPRPGPRWCPCVGGRRLASDPDDIHRALDALGVRVRPRARGVPRATPHDVEDDGRPAGAQFVPRTYTFPDCDRVLLGAYV